MRGLISVLVAMQLSVPAFAQDGFFCTTPGISLCYERSEVKSGKLKETSLFEVDSVYRKGDVREIAFHVTRREKNGRPILGGRTALTMDIDDKGTTYLNFGETVQCFVRNYFRDANLKYEGTDAILPADARAGDTLPDANCTVTVLGFKLTVSVSERSIIKEETVSVPAGTFHCIVVKEHRVEKAPFHNRDFWMQTWYCKGQGYVKHEVYDKNMKHELTEVLVQKSVSR